MSNEVLTIQSYSAGIRVTNCNSVALESMGCGRGFPRQRESKCRRWGQWSEAKAPSSKMTFSRHSPGQGEDQGKIQGSAHRHVYEQTFCVLKRQSWKAIISRGQQLAGVQHPTRWLFTFYELQCDLREIFWAFMAEIYMYIFPLSTHIQERVKSALALLVHKFHWTVPLLRISLTTAV